MFHFEKVFTSISLAKLASKYNSKILIRYKNNIVNAKSVTGILTSGIKWNKTIIIIVQGDDEEVAMEGLITFLKKL